MRLKFVSLNMFSTNLRVIDLSHNFLTCLPEDFADISNLESLNIEYNKLTELPSQTWRL